MPIYPPLINAQHECIADYLSRHPRATAQEIAAGCHVPDPEARLGELEALGRVRLVAGWEVRG